jgi:hypothetical protein
MTTPSILILECPFIQRAGRNETNDDFVGDFEVVADGMLVVDEEKLTIFEYADYKKCGMGAQSKLVIYHAAIEKIEGKRIRSEHRNFDAGRIRMYGTFDEARGEERITLKQHPEEYLKLKAALVFHQEN